MGSPISAWSARSQIWPASISASREKGSQRPRSVIAVEKGEVDHDGSLHRPRDRTAKLAKDDSPAGSSHFLLGAASYLDADLRLPLPPLCTRPRVRGVLLSRLPPPWRLRHDGPLRRIAGGNCDRARSADRLPPADGALLDASRVHSHRQERRGGHTASPTGVCGGAFRDRARRTASDRSPSPPPRALRTRPLCPRLCEPLLLGRAQDKGSGEHAGLRPRREHAAPLYEYRACPLAPDARVAGGDCAMESSLAGGERATGGAPLWADTRCRESPSASRARGLPLRTGVADDEYVVAMRDRSQRYGASNILRLYEFQFGHRW